MDWKPVRRIGWVYALSSVFFFSISLLIFESKAMFTTEVIAYGSIRIVIPSDCPDAAIEHGNGVENGNGNGKHCGNQGQKPKGKESPTADSKSLPAVNPDVPNSDNYELAPIPTEPEPVDLPEDQSGTMTPSDPPKMIADMEAENDHAKKEEKVQQPEMGDGHF